MGNEKETEILKLEDYRIDFCSYVYELLQDDMDNTRANAIIDLYDELFSIAEHLERENSGTKNEEETDTRKKLEAIHKQLTSQINDLRKQGKEPKAVEYTIKVCFE